MSKMEEVSMSKIKTAQVIVCVPSRNSTADVNIRQCCGPSVATQWMSVGEFWWNFDMNKHLLFHMTHLPQHANSYMQKKSPKGHFVNNKNKQRGKTFCLKLLPNWGKIMWLVGFLFCDDQVYKNGFVCEAISPQWVTHTNSFFSHS